MIKAEFSASLLQSSVSHDHSNMISDDTMIYFIFHNSLINKTVQKNSIYLEKETYVFTVTFDQFNASLMNKKY